MHNFMILGEWLLWKGNKVQGKKKEEGKEKEKIAPINALKMSSFGLWIGKNAEAPSPLLKPPYCTAKAPPTTSMHIGTWSKCTIYTPACSATV